MTFGFSDGSRNFLKLFFPSPEKFLFCTDEIESIEWQELVPRLRIGARGAGSPVRLLQGALVILVRKHTSKFRSFAK